MDSQLTKWYRKETNVAMLNAIKYRLIIELLTLRITLKWLYKPHTNMFVPKMFVWIDK